MNKIENLKFKFNFSNMILYAGSTWDWHKIHYDPEYLKEKSIPKPVVDGQVFGSLISKQLLAHFGKNSRIVRMDFKFKSMVFEGESIEIKSDVINNNITEDDINSTFEVSSTIFCNDRIVIENAISLIKILK